MVQVRGYTEDDVDVLADEFEAVIQRSLQRAVAAGANNLTGAVTAASSAALQPEDVAIVQHTWQEEVDGVLVPYVGEVYTGSATAVAVGLAEGFPSEELAGIPLIADEFQLTFMKSVTGSFVGIGDEVWQDVRTVLVDGIKNGESVEQIAAKMMHLTDFTQNHATLVARTAIHSAAESGSIAQLRFMGYEDHEVEKEWLATHDGRTRPTHWAADKQKVPLSGKFTVGLSKLDFPGDPLGAFAEIIQCRCTALFNIDTPPKMRCNGVLVAASTQSTQCVMPVPQEDISAIDSALRNAIFAAFMKAKISPAWGGSKIHKVLADVRTASAAGEHGFAQPLDDAITDMQLLKVVDSMYTGTSKKTFSEAYWEWLQSPAGKKATAGLAKPSVTHVIAPIQVPAPSVPVVRPLPPVAVKPAAAQLTFTGKTLGSHGAEVWVNPSTGEKWLFKPQADWMTDLDVGIAKIQSKARDMRPGIYEMSLGGKKGSIQYMFESGEAWPGGMFDPLKLTQEEIATLQQGQIFDWMISNFDTHTGQWIRLKDGQLFGTDKGQAFKFFGKDKLSWDYVPVTPLGQDKLTYTAMWKAYVQGKGIALQDPTQGELGAYIDRLMAIPDKEYADLLRPYAEWRAKLFGDDADKFLAKAVARKNSLKADFADFWQKAEAERALHLPKPTPLPKPVAPLPPAPATTMPPIPLGADLGDISKFDYFFKQTVLDEWVKLGGGKKVTPAWGGAKIWKLLEELKAWGDTQTANFGGPEITHLQLLRMLDDAGGFKGKPKTYEGELLKWLDSPAGKKGGPLFLPDSLKITKPIVTPVIKPTTIGQVLANDDVSLALQAKDNKVSVNVLFVDLPKYQLDDVVGYVKTANGDTLKATKFDRDAIGIYVRKDSIGDTQWLFEGSFKTWEQIVKEYNISMTDPWSLIPPPKPILKTKIPGKAPGDIVTSQEMWDSRYLWKFDEVIGQASGNDYEIRLVSLGDGTIQLQNFYKFNPSQGWTVGGTLTDSVDFNQLQAVLDKHQWKLGGSAIDSTKTSPLYQTKSVGDVVTPQEIWGATAGAKLDDVMAYAYSGFSQQEMKLLWNPVNGLRVYTRPYAGSSWLYEDTFPNLQAFHIWGQQYKWSVPNVDGSMPDVMKALIPGKKVPGAKTATKFNGVAAGEEVPFYEVQTQAWQFNDYEILANGTSNQGKVFYQMYKLPDGKVALEYRYGTAGDWNVYKILDPDKSMSLQMADIGFSPSAAKWYASVDKVDISAQSTKEAVAASKTIYGAPAKKAAKKTAAPLKKAAKKVAPTLTPPAPSKVKYENGKTPFAGKVEGSSLGNGQEAKSAIIGLSGSQELVDGQIVATLTTTGWNPTTYRVVFMQGHLVAQKQSKAGSWIGSQIVKNTWDLAYSSEWKAGSGFVSKPNHNALKKFIDKKTGGAPGVKTITPTGAKAGPKPAAVPAPSAPFVMRHVDLTPWNDTEQEEIYQFFRSQHIYVSSDPQSIWGAVQGVKSHFQTKYGGKYLNLNEVEILRIADARGALKHGVVDTHPMESKVVNWLKTNAGKSYVNKKIDAPIAAVDVPVPMTTIESSGIPLDQQTYAAITRSESLQNRKDSHARYGGWKPGEQAALKKYTGGSYTSWNDAIRKGDISSYRNDILKAQHGMRPSVRPMLLHRKTSFAELNDPGIISYETLLPYVGRTYLNRGFNSTSYSDKVWSGNLHIEIEAPIGTPMSHAQDYSHYGSEEEVTLAAHLIYEILSVKKKGSTTVMRVRVIGAATP